MAILEVENLEKNFGEYRVLNGVSIKIDPGKICVLIGPNGSGKTTLINCITGVYKPDNGKVLFKGKDMTSRSPNEVCDLGIGRTFQIPAPFKALSVYENLMTSAKDQIGERLLIAPFRQKWAKQEAANRERAMGILQEFGIDSKCNNAGFELSGGQLKLLELCRLLMQEVEFAVLDEPVGSINPVLADKIFIKIRNMRDSYGMTFLIVEHRLDIAMKYADHVFGLVEGRVVCEGSPKTVLCNQTLQETYLGLRK